MPASESSVAREASNRPTAWSPLRLPMFRALWLATIVSNIGTWMHEIGAGWLMTSLTDSPVMVALVQTATTLPIFLLALPAGALADIVDRRLHLLSIQAWLASVAVLLGALTLLGLTTAWMLVGLTFAMGIGIAMMLPAWAAITPEIVPRRELPGALVLNSMAMNTARAIGPAVAGVIVATAGTGAVFLLNAVSFLAVVVVLYRWQRQPSSSTLPAERFLTALRTGYRFGRHHRPLHAAVVRGIGFVLFASATWALMPLVARQLVGGGPQTFGLLVAGIGAGAVVAAVLIPHLRARLSRDALVAWATGLAALSMVVQGNVTNLWVLEASMLAHGFAWITVLSTLHVAAQLALPNWVRSRGLAVFMAAFMGSMASGSFLWGVVAEQWTIPVALEAASLGAVLAIAATWRWQISGIEDLNLEPAIHWPPPSAPAGVDRDRGPVMVNIRYAVEPEQRATFLGAVRELGTRRKRDGAFVWGIMEDAAQPNDFIEYYMVESWLEHLRQHERVTEYDHALQERLRELLRPGAEPVIAHYIAPGRRRARQGE